MVSYHINSHVSLYKRVLIPPHPAAPGGPVGPTGPANKISGNLTEKHFYRLNTE